jgi:hypothetical protein
MKFNAQPTYARQIGGVRGGCRATQSADTAHQAPSELRAAMRKSDLYRTCKSVSAELHRRFNARDDADMRIPASLGKAVGIVSRVAGGCAV